MAEVSQKESIMSLITATPEKRERNKRKDRKRGMDFLDEEEESMICLKLPENVERVEQTDYLRYLESGSNEDGKSEMEITTEANEKRYGENEEKRPNLKRRQTSVPSLDKSIIEGEGSMKKLRINSEPRDEQAVD